MREKERRQRESEEKKRRRTEKSNGCTLSFCNNHFGDEGPFGSNVVKNSARYIFYTIKC